jgi:putative tricarboxylic transport membrane protein
MLEYILGGFVDTFTITNLLMVFAGTFVGIVFGAIPGLSTDLAVILFLPITFTMDILPSILLLLGIYCGGTYGGSITAILIGTPGTNVAVATVFDGYPLAKKGYAKKALGMALYASTIGGFISALLLLFTAPFISEFVLKFGPPEYFCLAVFGISVIAGVSGNSLFRGIIMGCFGFFVSTIGVDSASGATRFTFGNVFLMKGLGLLPVLLGVFALPNILNQMYARGYLKSFSNTSKLSKTDNLTKEDKKRCRPIIMKSTVIGSIIGAIPGAGAGIAAFMAYNEAKRTSKCSQLYGEGELEGIAAPEAANNAVTGCSLIPLFTLGIPGSVVAALLIGAFTMQGLTPGPTLFRTQGPLMYAIMVGLIVCNIAMWIEGKYMLKFFAQISKVPQPVLFTSLALFCVAGSFSFSNNMFDVYVLLIFGIIMFLIQRLGFPGAPFVLGIILGPLMESNLANSLVMSDGSWFIFFQRPISVVIMLITIFFTAYSVLKTRQMKKDGAKQTGEDEATALED